MINLLVYDAHYCQIGGYELGNHAHLLKVLPVAAKNMGNISTPERLVGLIVAPFHPHFDNEGAGVVFVEVHCRFLLAEKSAGHISERVPLTSSVVYYTAGRLRKRLQNRLLKRITKKPILSGNFDCGGLERKPAAFLSLIWPQHIGNLLHQVGHLGLQLGQHRLNLSSCCSR